MIITKNANVKIFARNNKYYAHILNKILKNGDEIEINIKLLPNNSHYLIDAECDICKKQLQIKYSLYMRSFLNGGYFTCKTCKHIKIKKSNLEKYGIENYVNVEKRKKTISKNPNYWNDRSDKTIKSNLEKYGVKNVSQVEKIKKKKKETTLKHYGVENPYQSEEIKEKCKIKHLQNLGVEYPSQHETIKQKKKETCLRNHNVEFPMQSKEIHNKSKQTMLKKYGVEYNGQREEVKIKLGKNMSTPEFREKSKQTMLKKYGVEHPLKNKKIFEKQQTNAFKRCEYENFTYQGTYELDFLKRCEELNISIENANMTIEYYYNGKNRTYFPDFYMPSKNLICEIKSSYFYQKHYDSNIVKQKECLRLGYEYIFIIDKNYDVFFDIIKN